MFGEMLLTVVGIYLSDVTVCLYQNINVQISFCPYFSVIRAPHLLDSLSSCGNTFVARGLKMFVCWDMIGYSSHFICSCISFEVSGIVLAEGSAV